MSVHKTSTISCHLVCLQNTHQPIPLPDGETVVIGRTPQTQIIDPQCSRKQVSLTADWTKREVKVTQLGPNNSSIDGKDIGKGNEISVKSSSTTIFIVAGAFPHRISFKTSKRANLSRDDSLSPPVLKPAVSVKRSNPDSSPSSDAKRRKLEGSSEKDRSERKEDKNGSVTPKEADRGQKTENGVSPDENDSDEDLREKEAKLAKLQIEASRGKSLSSGSKDGKHKQPESSASQSKKVTQKTFSSSSQSSSSSSSTSKPSSQGAAKSEWTSHDQLCVFTSKGVTSHRKVAAFDMDGTIIVTSSGKVFPTDKDDWKIFHPDVFGKMKDLNSKGYKIVFFTNQLGVAKGKTNIDDLKVKVENIVRKLQVPVQVFIATHEGKYRKPNDGMWEKLSKSYNSGKEIDLKTSLYVGDAAGREKDWAPKRKKDFSCSDRLFALNVGVQFFTPEEFFLKQKPTQKFVMPLFDPRKMSSDAEAVPGGTFSDKKKEIIVLVGFPACGKSHFSSNVLQPKGYKIVSRDELGSWQKCVQKAGEYLAGTNVAVDNTNLTVEERARYTKLAQSAKVPCRCFVFTTSVEHCRHNERFRQMSGGKHAKINEMVFNKMKFSYKEPSMKEGFSQVVNVNFVPTFSSSSDEAKYRKFLLEK